MGNHYVASRSHFHITDSTISGESGCETSDLDNCRQTTHVLCDEPFFESGTKNNYKHFDSIFPNPSCLRNQYLKCCGRFNCAGESIRPQNEVSV
jgi:hypothetical protein